MAIPLSFEVRQNSSEQVKKKMGIDVGLRQLAVTAVGTSSIFFNGKEMAYKRRRFASRRRELGKAKKYQQSVL